MVSIKTASLWLWIGQITWALMLLMFTGWWWQGIRIFREGVLARLHCRPFSPEFPFSPLLSSLDTACIFLFTEGSSAWIIWLNRYWCIKLRVWFLSRPCHQSQFARALAECNISLIRSTRKLRRWTVLIREEIIKLRAPGIISPSEHYCKPHEKNKTNPPSPPSFAGWDKEKTRNADRWMRFHLVSLCFSLQTFSRFFSPSLLRLHHHLPEWCIKALSVLAPRGDIWDYTDTALTLVKQHL